MIKICSVSGCGGDVVARSWCSRHYNQWRAPRRVVARKLYRASEAGIAKAKEYSQSPAGRESCAKYARTLAGRASHRRAIERYSNSLNGIEVRRKYEQSAAAKERRRAWRASPAGQECYRRSQAKERLSPERNEKKRLAAKKFYHSAMGQRPEAKFRIYKTSATRRGLPFELTFSQFFEFWGKPCSYCGEKIKKVGIDRVDNLVGYIASNVVSCCRDCNLTKRNWTKDFFLSHCLKVVRFNSL